MATSQFTYYSSADAGGPGPVTGQVGSVTAILRACLVNGYSGHPAAGWTEPLATTSNRAAFQQGTGSCGFHLFINDNNLSGYAYDAAITGWESMLTLDAPNGTGSGQFPLPAQANSTGYLALSKSDGNNATQRSWRIYADSRTIYWFVSHDGASGLSTTWFGDIFSLSGLSDTHRCFLYSRAQYGSPGYTYEQAGFYSNWSAAVTAHYMARSLGGVGSSLPVGKHPGNTALYGTSGQLNGALACPNPADNAVWLSPLYIHEPSGGGASIRGRLRGMWSPLHNYSNFSDGQIISGAGELAGKTFQAVRYITNPYNQPCVIFIETSNTVETN